MSDDTVASMKIAKLVRMLLRDKRTNPAAPLNPSPEQPIQPTPQPAQG